MIYHGLDCTCGKPWMSHCLIHAVKTWASTGTGLACKGRHCAHDLDCRRYQYTATWNTW